MRKLLLATTALVALAAPAMAADLPVKAPPIVVVTVYNWTGFYIGGNVGFAWGPARTTTEVPAATFAIPAAAAEYSAIASPNFNSRGFIGGGQAGFNIQRGNVVFGVEADINAFRLRGSADTFGDPAGGVALASHTEVNTDWLFTARGRLGLARDRGLAYVTGGLAVTNIKYLQTNNYIGVPGIETASISSTRAGWTAGGGLEYAVTDNWSLKAEYLHVRFGSVSTTAFHPANLAEIHRHSASLNAHIARVGLNYHFGGPVIARY